MSKRIWTKEQITDIIELYEKVGATLKDIGKKYATKGETISKILKNNGIIIKNKATTTNRLLNHTYFSQIDTPAKAYFLGLLFADGNIALTENHSPALRLELVETDIEILNILKKELNCNSKLSYNKRKEREHGTYSLSIRSKQIADDLSKWNIIPNKTYTVKEINIPQHFKEDFLRGFIDGDGSIYISLGLKHISICGHTENIIRQFAELGNSLINKGKINKIILDSNNVYRYCWSGKAAVQLSKILYTKNCISIARKKIKAMSFYEDN